MKKEQVLNEKEFQVYRFEPKRKLLLPLFAPRISAGFPSPAEDYIEIALDLNEHLVKKPQATFFVIVKGNSMEQARISEGDLLIVDKSLRPKNRDIVLAVLDGEFTVKRFIKEQDGTIFLVPENKTYKPIKISPEMDFKIWGVVTYIIFKAK